MLNQEDYDALRPFLEELGEKIAQWFGNLREALEQSNWMIEDEKDIMQEYVENMDE